MRWLVLAVLLVAAAVVAVLWERAHLVRSRPAPATPVTGSAPSPALATEDAPGAPEARQPSAARPSLHTKPIDGTVVDPAGKGVGFLRLVARGEPPALDAQSDREGRFSFGEAPEGTYALEVANPRVALESPVTFRAGERIRPVVVPVFRFSISVLDDETLEAVPAFEATLVVDDTRIVVPGRDGELACSERMPGSAWRSWTLELRAAGYFPSEVSGGPLQDRPHSHVLLEPLRRANVRLRTVYADGTPYTGPLQVQCRAKMGPDRDGRWLLRVPTGDVRLAVSRPVLFDGRREFPLQLPEGVVREVDVVFPVGGTLVVHRGGDSEFIVRRGERQTGLGFRDEDERRVVLADVLPGRYRIWPLSSESDVREVEVRAGRVSEVELP